MDLIEDESARRLPDSPSKHPNQIASPQASEANLRKEIQIYNEVLDKLHYEANEALETKI